MASVSRTTATLPTKRTAYFVLFMVWLVYLVSFMDRQILSILQDDIKAEFGLQDYQLGLLTGLSFALFYTGLGVPIARLADRKSRVGILSISLVVWSAMTVLCGMAGSYISLFLARMGVGVGEAGSGPPSQSLLSDYFEKKELSKALSIYGTAVSVGAVLGVYVGGNVAEAYGWRMAFLVVGAPGILLGLIFWLTVKEPPRGQFTDEDLTSKPSLPFWSTAKELFGRKTYVGAVLTHALGVALGYAAVSWIPPFFGRTFGLERDAIILYTIAVFLFGGLPGILSGGFLATRLVKRDPSWQMRIPLIGSLVALPFYVAGFSGYWGATGSAVLLVLAGFFVQWTYAPTLALIQATTEPDRRALAASMVILSSNIIGLGMGPLIIGALSDLLAPQHGDASLAQALMWFSSVAILAAGTAWWTMRHSSRSSQG